MVIDKNDEQSTPSNSTISSSHSSNLKMKTLQKDIIRKM